MLVHGAAVLLIGELILPKEAAGARAVLKQAVTTLLSTARTA